MKKIQKILVPLDGSSCSRRALDVAITLAKDKNITIMGMHVIRMPIKFLSKTKKHYVQNATKIIASASIMSKKAHVPFKSKILSNGYVGKEITSFAQNNNFDLIVMGSRGPNPIAEMFLGSVANYVVIKSKIPVMIVK